MHTYAAAICGVVCTVMQVGMISRAAGSAYAEFGQTKLMVAVYGPRPSVIPLSCTRSSEYVSTEPTLVAAAKGDTERHLVPCHVCIGKAPV